MHEFIWIISHYILYATAFTLPVTFRVEHWGCLAAALQGRGHNTLKTAQEGTKEETSLPVKGQSKQKLRSQLVAQTRKTLEEIPMALEVQLLAEEREGSE